MNRRIKRVVVTLEDGTPEVYVGTGHITNVNTVETLEFWDRDKPDAKKPRTKDIPVSYITVAFSPDSPD